ncbi:MAG: hypothetical protein HFJ29_03325 [Clostridia bacterium]|nr:hypothetical protein [Clostridia bacterium]
MNKDKKIYFKTNALGKLKILCLIDKTALIEKMYNTKEKYIVAVNFDIENCCWDFGFYRTSFQEAFEDFRERVYLGKHISLSEKTKSNYDLDI